MCVLPVHAPKPLLLMNANVAVSVFLGCRTISRNAAGHPRPLRHSKPEAAQLPEPDSVCSAQHHQQLQPAELHVSAHLDTDAVHLVVYHLHHSADCGWSQHASVSGLPALSTQAGCQYAQLALPELGVQQLRHVRLEL